MELDRNALKLQAYKEKLIIMEEANADLRVEITVLSNTLQEAQSSLAELQASSEQHKQADPDVPQEQETS